MIITIDGPVASGKSTVARQLAHDLGFYYLYTGFLYRGIAYVLAHWYHYDNAALSQVQEADLKDIIEHHSFEYRYENGKPLILFDGNDISPFLKNKDVDNWASRVSAQPLVRHAVFDYQVALGKGKNLIAEGRDMATVVFPQAEYKFFLTADEKIRAQRWQQMQQKMGNSYTLDECLQAIHERDRRDKERPYSPLTQTADMCVIDCSHLSAMDVVAFIKKQINTVSMK